MPTPRVFIIRHGETEWSLNGRHTGTSDIPLTANGEKRIRATGKALVGSDRLIVPSKISHVYVSPRHRAQRTLELLNLDCHESLPWSKSEHPSQGSGKAKVQITQDIREWDYGDYEGLRTAEIRKSREEKGLDPKWDIWRDGCEGGESPEDVTERLDKLIQDIRQRFHAPAFEQKNKPKQPPADAEAGDGDVLIVAHGHILRAFAMRWVGRKLTDGVSLILEAGGVGTLRYIASALELNASVGLKGADLLPSYEHDKIEEPAILLGGAFMVDVVENVEAK